MIPLNRHAPAVLWRKLKLKFEPTLDPSRVAKVYKEYDEQRGYAAWHQRCKAALARPLPVRETPGPVVTTGFSVQQVVSADEAASLLADASGDRAPSQLKRDSAKLQGYGLEDPAIVRRLAESALTPEVDAQCLEFFGSEYFVYWYMLSRTEPSEGPATVSFMWHCDRGPRAHLKLLVYLNDYSEHGGGTSYLDVDSTEAAGRGGYMFTRGRRRTGSLEELSAIAKRPLRPYDHHPRAGDAVLFQPSRVLHSGITPKLGPRYVFTLCLLPSPVHWTKALERGAQVDLRNDPIWHPDAAALAQKFGPGF